MSFFCPWKCGYPSQVVISSRQGSSIVVSGFINIVAIHWKTQRILAKIGYLTIPRLYINHLLTLKCYLHVGLFYEVITACTTTSIQRTRCLVESSSCQTTLCQKPQKSIRITASSWPRVVPEHTTCAQAATLTWKSGWLLWWMLLRSLQMRYNYIFVQNYDM